MKPTETLFTAAQRVEQMERLFDILLDAERTDPTLLQNDAACTKALRRLVQYYEGGDWLQDYTLDEQGLLPQTLKRGVLAQDAVYNFLHRTQQAADIDPNHPGSSASACAGGCASGD